MNRDRLISRFLKYTKVDTQAACDAETTPSSPGQLELARIVAEDLKAAGFSDVELDAQGFLFGTLHENIPNSHPAKGKTPTIGFLSHFDTATEVSGRNVKARLVENYDGGEITYPANPSLKLTPEISPALKNCVGHTVITSDGTTLLGGDDKAGLSVIVEMGHHFKENPSLPHGKIRVAIIPDEEIGVGTEKLDLKKFGVDFAYTIDGGETGLIDVESFNGFMGKVEVEGCAAFPGYGKGQYTNAAQVLSRFVAAMPAERWPQNCDGRQPIWWVERMEGTTSKASTAIYLRDFDLEGIEEAKGILESIRKDVMKEFPKAKISIDINETYRNYRYELDRDPRVVAYAEEAMKRVGIAPKRNFVRGGNDSCHLCFAGLLSTNLFIGMQNMHSLMEWNTVESIEAALKTVVSLAGVWVDKAV